MLEAFPAAICAHAFITAEAGTATSTPHAVFAAHQKGDLPPRPGTKENRKTLAEGFIDFIVTKYGYVPK